jgi:hypothetical protein
MIDFFISVLLRRRSHFNTPFARRANFALPVPIARKAPKGLPAGFDSSNERTGSPRMFYSKTEKARLLLGEVEPPSNMSTR